MALDPIYAILLIILGAVLGIVYSLRRLFRVEKAILNLEKQVVVLKGKSSKKK